ncbi:MAG: prolipoprotein diacylglyceryl transferase, partial [Victivallaceae bacterium]|nr:prolipoprotein diacylglyceryl transferase [Victivallaceae bacterium]
RVLDISAPAIAIAHACGRIGCFLNGCCYGGATDLPWGVCYPAGSAADLAGHGAALHPVQLYEAGEMVLCAIFFAWLVRRTGRGVAMSSYLIVYGILRFLNELARGDNPHWLGLFTPAQWIGLGMVPLGVAMLIWFVRHERKKA